MAYTSSQLETIISTLEDGLKGGFARISVEGRGSVDYRGSADIFKAISYFTGLLNQVTATAPRSRIARVITDKGF